MELVIRYNRGNEDNRVPDRVLYKKVLQSNKLKMGPIRKGRQLEISKSGTGLKGKLYHTDIHIYF